MEYTTLGKTGLKVSVAGLGCGGFSKLGQGTGATEGESIALVRQAADLGVNFFDTARAYGTEAIVGKALKELGRDHLVVSTKTQATRGNKLKSGNEVVEDLEASLRDLQTEQVEVFHLHGVPPWACEGIFAEIVPALLRQRDKGKLLFLGITELPPEDPGHLTIGKVLDKEVFQVVMVAFHMLNQQARQKVFKQTMAAGVGTLIMFAVRVIFSQPERLRRAVVEEVAAGRLPQWLAQRPNPLSFLLRPEGASSLTDAAYRYCRHEPGADVVLFGTGNPLHLKANVASILRGPLPAVDTERIAALFGALEGVGLDRPSPP